MAILYALLAAVAWGAADYGSGIAARTRSTIVVSALVLGLAAPIAIGLALLLEGLPDGRTVAVGVAAGLITAVGVTTFFHALSIGVIGTVAPIAAAGTMIPVLIGLARGDAPSTLQLAGIALIVGGVIVIAAATGDGDVNRYEGLQPRKAVFFSIVASATLGMYFVLAKEGAATNPIGFAGVGQLVAALPLVALAIIRREPRPHGIGHLGLLAIANGIGWFFSTLALGAGLLSVTSVVIALYPALTVVLAMVLTGERLSPIQAAGALATLGGVAAIAAG